MLTLSGYRPKDRQGRRQGRRPRRKALISRKKWSTNKLPCAPWQLFQTCRSFQSALLETERRQAHSSCDRKGRHGRGGSRARVAAPSGNLAQGLPCPARVRRLFLSGRDAILQRSPLGKIFAGMQGRLGMQGRAGQARYAHNLGLLQRPYQSRAARQQTLLLPNWNAMPLLSSHVPVACPATPRREHGMRAQHR